VFIVYLCVFPELADRDHLLLRLLNISTSCDGHGVEQWSIQTVKSAIKVQAIHLADVGARHASEHL
jgi:DUF971 family protein